MNADVVEELGSEMHVIFSVDAPPVRHASLTDAVAEQGDEDAAAALAGGKSLWTARVAARSSASQGQQIELAVDTERMHYFDKASGLAIGTAQAAVAAS